MEFLVVGGRQDSNAMAKEEWHRFKKGIVAKVSPSYNEQTVCIEYVSPPEACDYNSDPSILFKAGSLLNGHLYLCTQTEVLVYDDTNFEQLYYLSLPCFNDIHHVCPSTSDSLLIAVTGLDMVVEVTLEGRTVREWGVMGQDPWARFSRAIDYRKVVTTKPHLSHPNFVFDLEGEIWVTRFEQKDAVCLTAELGRILIDVEKPHDGVRHGGRVYFTTVDGHVVIIEAKSRKVEAIVDLNRIDKPERALGWCRGLAVLGDHSVVVGFSRIRPTRLRENLRWMGYEVGLRDDRGDLPTRIVAYDLQRFEKSWEIDLESCGLNAVFSVHPLG